MSIERRLRASLILLPLLLHLLHSPPPSAAAAVSDVTGQFSSRRAVIDVAGGPESVIWAVQLSDLHFSGFHPDRARDFRRIVGPTLAMINPSLVLITGDLTDGKSKDLLTMKQEEAEWVEYQDVLHDVIETSGLHMKIFYDLRGNHDRFGVPGPGHAFDFYHNYSVNAMQRRTSNVQSVTLQNGGWKHLFVGFDSVMQIGVRGPTNLFGHPTDQILEDLDIELGQLDTDSVSSLITKVSFGHFPLSFSAPSDTGKSLKAVFLRHKLSAYLCGHLHARFGKNLKRHHQKGNHWLTSGTYYQYNLHDGTPPSADNDGCSPNDEVPNEFWEWEMGDWRKSRSMRIVAIDTGHVSYLDLNFEYGSKETIILPTFPVDSRFMQRISSPKEYSCQRTLKRSSYDMIRALIFSKQEIISVSVKVYDSRPGKLNMVLDSPMEKVKGNGTRGDLYSSFWNWRAFVDPSPDRYWLQIEAIDISMNTVFSQLRPFSVNGLTARVNWKWKEFWVMGIQWASLYQPILWSVLFVLFSLLLVPRACLVFPKYYFTYNNINSGSGQRNIGKQLLYGTIWMLIELSRVTPIWSGVLFYLIYLLFFPWFFGHVFTSGGELGYMTYKGWVINKEQSYVAVPDVMVVVLPHLCFVVLPTILLSAAMIAEVVAYRSHYLSLSGKKEDDYKVNLKHRSPINALFFWRGRWIRKLLLMVCLVILWKHWKSCRAIVKAYEINPLIHSPVYCFVIPSLLAYAIYRTSAV